MAARDRRKWLKILVSCLVACFCLTQPILAAEDNIETVPEPTATPIPIETNFIEGWPQGPEVTAETACLIDANTGTVLYNKNMTVRMHPASTTKVMTALIVLENVSLDEVFTFTETGVAEAYSGSSNLITQVGEQFTVEDAIYALMLKSANDFASQIAEYVGGSVENFVQMMNDKAAELGCVNTHFNNAHGMTDENHYSCAYDLALIMQEAYQNQDFCRIAGSLKYVIPATHLTPQRTIETHNGLIMEGEHFYEGCIAGKTGYTDAAWCTFVSVAERNGMTLIESTMRSKSSAESFINAKLLYDYGFNNFQNLTIKEGNQVYSGGVITVPSGVTLDNVTAEQGDTISTDLGMIQNETYYYNGHEVGQMAVPVEPVVQEEQNQEIEQELAEYAAEEAAYQKEKDEKAQAFEEKKDFVFKILIIVLVVLVVVGTVMIYLGVQRNKRSIRRKRERENRKG